MAGKLKGIQDLFSLLSLSAAKVNSLLSIPVLCYLVTRIISTSVGLFLTISYMINLKGTGGQYSTVSININLLIPYAVFISVILLAADLPVKEVLISNLILWVKI